jgi:DNA-binding NarL/FixJ family response regulator
MSAKLRILLADDHETVREGLRMILNAQSDLQVVATAGDGAEAITECEKISPDALSSVRTTNPSTATASSN